MNVYLPIYRSIYQMSIYLCICLSLLINLFLPLYLPAFLSVLSIYPSGSLSTIYPSTYPFIYLYNTHTRTDINHHYSPPLNRRHSKISFTRPTIPHCLSSGTTETLVILAQSQLAMRTIEPVRRNFYTQQDGSNPSTGYGDDGRYFSYIRRRFNAEQLNNAK